MTMQLADRQTRLNFCGPMTYVSLGIRQFSIFLDIAAPFNLPLCALQETHENCTPLGRIMSAPWFLLLIAHYLRNQGRKDAPRLVSIRYPATISKDEHNT